MAAQFVGTKSSIFFLPGLIIAIFSSLQAWKVLPYKTKGYYALHDVLGYKEYLITAKETSLDTFFFHLPYALAFDSLDKWAGVFRDVRWKKPTWFITQDKDMNPALFASSVETFIHILHKSMACKK